MIWRRVFRTLWDLHGPAGRRRDGFPPMSEGPLRLLQGRRAALAPGVEVAAPGGRRNLWPPDRDARGVGHIPPPDFSMATEGGPGGPAA